MSFSITLSYQGQLHALVFSEKASRTINELQVAIERAVGVQQDTQRLFQNRRRIDCSDGSRDLRDVCDEASPLVVISGASTVQIETMKASYQSIQREKKIRETRRVVNITTRNKEMQSRDAAATRYRFHAIEPIEKFADQAKAYEILEKLATDRGILAVMAKHKWSVGVLAEMLPDGKVGVDPVCVLGLNQGKGQKILLRLRTDDLCGFRKFLSIKKVLFHELSHNVHSEHDNKFYQLLRQVEKECSELDWTCSGGAAVGGSPAIMHDDDSTQSVGSGHRLGGGSALRSRPVDSGPLISITRERAVPVTKQQAPSAEQSPATEFKTDITTSDLEVKNVEIKPKSATLEQVNTSHAGFISAIVPEVHVITADEETATLAMSGREKRIYEAVHHLQTLYNAETIEKAASLLFKIVSNIISHPTDAKFRSIRKANRLFETQVAKFPECLEFLLALGFEDQSDKIVLARDDPALLWIGQSTLEMLLPVAAS